MMIKVIVVSGTPGTGKTKVAKLISKNSDFKYININEIIKNKKISESYDKKRKCYVVDVKKLNKVLINLIKSSNDNLILDSHLAHFLPRKYVDLCAIMKCNLKLLKKRLIKRKYSSLKIKENLESEIFNVCLSEAKKLRHNVIVIDTTHGVKHLNMKKITDL